MKETDNTSLANVPHGNNCVKIKACYRKKKNQLCRVAQFSRFGIKSYNVVFSLVKLLTLLHPPPTSPSIVAALVGGAHTLAIIYQTSSRRGDICFIILQESKAPAWVAASALYPSSLTCTSEGVLSAHSSVYHSVYHWWAWGSTARGTALCLRLCVSLLAPSGDQWILVSEPKNRTEGGGYCILWHFDKILFLKHFNKQKLHISDRNVINTSLSRRFCK